MIKYLVSYLSGFFRIRSSDKDLSTNSYWWGNSRECGSGEGSEERWAENKSRFTTLPITTVGKPSSRPWGILGGDAEYRSPFYLLKLEKAFVHPRFHIYLNWLFKNMIKITKKIVGLQYEGIYLKALDIKFIKYNSTETAYHNLVFLSWGQHRKKELKLEDVSLSTVVKP